MNLRFILQQMLAVILIHFVFHTRVEGSNGKLIKNQKTYFSEMNLFDISKKKQLSMISFFRKKRQEVTNEHEISSGKESNFYELNFISKRRAENNKLHERVRRSPPNGTTKMSTWGQWSTCSATSCRKSGVQKRTRRCMVGSEDASDQWTCRSALMQVRRCQVLCSMSTPSGQDTNKNNNTTRYDEWSQWSECSVTCGQGSQTRQRECVGILCSGELSENRICYTTSSCPDWSAWMGWSSCSSTCGVGGVQWRRRTCVKNRIAQNTLIDKSSDNYFSQIQLMQTSGNYVTVNASKCSGGLKKSEERRNCSNNTPCLRQWSSWEQWSQCSEKCGSGFNQRKRTCFGDTSIGLPCHGLSISYRKCNATPCWSSWSTCSKSCGMPGTRVRTRPCFNKVEHEENNSSCRGTIAEKETCDLGTCPVWSRWTRYSRCSQSCNGGVKTRTRKCKAGICNGMTVQTIKCNHQKCPEWSEWSSYTCCSVTCGDNGVRQRRRSCYSGFGYPGGCPGKSIERTACSMHPCNVTLPSVFDTFQCASSISTTSTQTTLVLRIIGGRKSRNGAWPWQGSWQHRACSSPTCEWMHYCGATLLAPQWVITAGHCIEEASSRVNHNDPGYLWSVVLGMNRLNVDGKRYFISKVFVHPAYNFQSVTVADIALLKTKQRIKFTSRIAPACLPHGSYPPPGEECYITGWGHTSSSRTARLSQNLQEARIPIVNFDECKKIGDDYRKFLKPTQHMCAGYLKNVTIDSCRGDSGGPMICQNLNNEWYLAAVTSFGFTNCGTKGHLGIYTPLHNFEKWINTTIENYSRDTC